MIATRNATQAPKLWLRRAAVVVAAVLLSGAAAVADSETRAGANDVVLRAMTDKNSVAIAEPLKLKLELTAPAATKISPLSLPSRLGRFQVIDTRTIADLPTETSSQRRVWRFELILESWRPGEQSIPPIEISYRIADAEEASVVASEPVAISVSSLLEDRGDVTDLRDLKDPIDLPVTAATDRRLLIAVASAIGTAALLWIAAAVWRRRSARVPPSVWAVAQIQQLETAIEANAISVDAVYTELTMILREFLLASGFICPGISGLELHRDRPDPQSDLPPELANDVERFFQFADQVKFVCLTLSREQARDSIAEAESLVRRCSQQGANVTREAS